MIGFALSLLLLAVDPGAPDVRGEGGCPSAQDVARRLRALSVAETDLPAGAWVELVELAPVETANSRNELEVRLMTGAPPRLLGARRLSASRSCDEGAEAAAVVAASWLANYRSPPPLWQSETTSGASWEQCQGVAGECTAGNLTSRVSAI